MFRAKYADGEAVLCFQGLFIYEAKIQGVRKENNVFEYDVHYKGWNKTWDEWVTDERLLKLTPENLKKQKEVEQEVFAKGKGYASKKTGGSAAPKKAPVPTTTTEKKKCETSGDEKKKPDSLAEKRKTEQPQTETKKQKSSEPLSKAVEIIKSQKPRSRCNSDASAKSNKSTSSSSKKDDAKRPKRAAAASLKSKLAAQAAAVAAALPKKSAASKKSKKVKKDGAVVGVGQTKVNKSSQKPDFKATPVEPKVLFGESLRLDIPEVLKTVLVDDFDYMIRQRKLTTLPSRYTVEDLLNAYSKSRQEDEGSLEKIASIEEVCRGLRDYFNATLGCQLLYKFERIQYADMLKENPDTPMCQLYGPVHLLRLITKLGPMLSASNVEKGSLDTLIDNLTEFISYIGRHKETLFQIEDYGTASPEYHRRAL